MKFANLRQPQWGRRFLGLLFATAFRCIPRGARFRLAVWISIVARPLVRRLYGYRRARARCIDSVREIALELVLLSLTRHGVEFDPCPRAENAEALDEARAEGRGTLVVSPHAMIFLSWPQWFIARGGDPIVIAMYTPFRLSGINRPARTIVPSPNFLLEVRTRLRQGELVVAMPDRPNLGERRMVEFSTVYGAVRLSDGLIRVATQCGAAIVFGAGHLDERNRVVFTMQRPSPAARSDADAVTAEFIAFVQAHVAHVAKLGGDAAVSPNV